MLVPVRPGLFMVESQRMQKLMLDDLAENTSGATQRHCLTSTTTTDKREAPKREKHLKPHHQSAMKDLFLMLFFPTCKFGNTLPRQWLYVHIVHLGI